MKAFVFPGQGSQSVGMGEHLYKNFVEARQVFEEVNDALNINLSKIIFEGSEQDLKLTENTQPALMSVSYAIVKVLELIANKNIFQIGKFVAGHSLGEYSALLSAGSVSLEETAKILRLRGKLMQEAVPFGLGAMAALIGADKEIVDKIKNKYVYKDEILDIGNDNSPGQVVISGNKSAVDRIIQNYKEFNIKKAIELPVSAPFHCALMNNVAFQMTEPIQNLKLVSPKLQLINNVDANFVNDSEKIKSNLIRQITATVRWRESIQNMISFGVSEFIELGSGKVLSGLIKRIDRNVKAHSIESIEDIEEFVKKLQA